MKQFRLIALIAVATFVAACTSSDVTAPPKSMDLKSVSADLISTNQTYCSVIGNNPMLFQVGGTWTDVNVLTPNPAWGSISGAEWIGPIANSGLTNVPVGNYPYQMQFQATAGSRIVGSILADNGVSLWVNSTSMGTYGATTSGDTPVAATFQTPSVFGSPTGVVDGLNLLFATLYNSGYSPEDQTPNPTGMSFCFTVQSCPAAPAVANAYLKAHSISPSSPRGKTILSAVAKNMTSGAVFSGLSPCNEGYQAAVIAFITPLL